MLNLEKIRRSIQDFKARQEEIEDYNKEIEENLDILEKDNDEYKARHEDVLKNGSKNPIKNQRARDESVVLGLDDRGQELNEISDEVDDLEKNLKSEIDNFVTKTQEEIKKEKSRIDEAFTRRLNNPETINSLKDEKRKLEEDLKFVHELIELHESRNVKQTDSIYQNLKRREQAYQEKIDEVNKNLDPELDEQSDDRLSDLWDEFDKYEEALENCKEKSIEDMIKILDSTFPEINQPNRSQPDQQQPSVDQPNQSQPDQQQPSADQPNQSQPDQQQPDADQPNQSQPDQQQPDEDQPNQSQPDQEQPDEPDSTSKDEDITKKVEEMYPVVLGFLRDELLSESNDEYNNPLDFFALTDIIKSIDPDLADFSNYSRMRLIRDSLMTRLKDDEIINDIGEILKTPEELSKILTEKYGKDVKISNNAHVKEPQKNGETAPSWSAEVIPQEGESRDESDDSEQPAFGGRTDDQSYGTDDAYTSGRSDGDILPGFGRHSGNEREEFDDIPEEEIITPKLQKRIDKEIYMETLKRIDRHVRNFDRMVSMTAYITNDEIYGIAEKYENEKNNVDICFSKVIERLFEDGIVKRYTSLDEEGEVQGVEENYIIPNRKELKAYIKEVKRENKEKYPSLFDKLAKAISSKFAKLDKGKEKPAIPEKASATKDTTAEPKNPSKEFRDSQIVNFDGRNEASNEEPDVDLYELDNGDIEEYDERE